MLPASPPTLSTYSIRKGSIGWYVYGLQVGLNKLGKASLVLDGVFGNATETAVKKFQTANNLVSDGIAGPSTQGKLVTLAVTHTESNSSVPIGIIKGISLLESGMMISQVNTREKGGIDCGDVQLRCYGPPYNQDAIKQAFDPVESTLEASDRFLDARNHFLAGSWVKGDHKRAGLCAALSHNWPAGALDYSKYGHVSNPTGACTWLPKDSFGNSIPVHFPDGSLVKTRQDFAEFYAIGGTHGPGQVTQFVTNWR